MKKSMNKLLNIFMHKSIDNKYVITILFMQFVFIVLYIMNTTSNIVYMDQIRMLQLVDKYYNGSLTFHDLWRSYLEHRTLVYHIIFLSNAILFHLNTRIEMYFSAFIILVTSIVVYRRYKKTMTINCSPTFIQISFFAISITLFSLNQWEALTLGIGAVLFARVLFFIISFLILDNILLQNNLDWKSGIKLTMLILASVLLFGAGYFPAFIGSMALVLFIKFFVVAKNYKGLLNKVRKAKTIINTMLIVFISTLAGAFLYFYNMNTDNMGTYTPIIQKLIYVFSHPIDAVKFFLLSNSANTIGVELAQTYLNKGIMLLAGAFILLLYVYSTARYIKSKMYHVTYMPMFLLIHSILIYGIILIGRLSYGISYGMSSRYVVEIQLGIVAVIWILIYDYKREAVKNKQKSIRAFVALTVLCFILGSQMVSNIYEWRASPYRKTVFEKMRMMAANPDNYSDEDLKLLQYDPGQIREGIRIMKKYNLNVYYDLNKGKK